MKCCLCNGTDRTKFCKVCGHVFCASCRARWFKRGYEALMTMLGHSSLYCGGQHG